MKSDESSSEYSSDEEQEFTMSSHPLRTDLLLSCDKPAVSENSNIVQAPAKETDQLHLLHEAVQTNSYLDAGYIRLQRLLSTRLRECRQAMKINQANLIAEAKKPENFRYYKCGKPYFKDHKFCSPPDNSDTIMMRQNNMYDFSGVCTVPGWTNNDKEELIDALHNMSVDIKKEKLEAQINALRRQNNPKNLPAINKLKREITELKKKPLAEIALPLEEEYDWDLLTYNLNRRHKSQEYRALWRLFLHPSITKKRWSAAEHKELQSIAAVYEYQNWEAIAEELNTGRTGYQCFVYYRTNMNVATANKKWTQEETEYLYRVIDFYREGSYIPWGKVAAGMNNRTKIQSYNKYQRMVEQRKGRFVAEEDAVILACYEKYGLNFNKMMEYLPGRSAMQLRIRFRLLTKLRLSTTWTIDQDKKLLGLMANLDSSAASYSVVTKHFPGKDRTHIRSRYLTLMKWMNNYPATDIALAPRRGARRLVHINTDISLEQAIENLKKRMETDMAVTKVSTKLSKTSSHRELDNAIRDLLLKEAIMHWEESGANELERDNVMSLPESSSVDITNLRKVLILLKSDLDRSKFQSSKYFKMYPGLSDDEQGVNQVKVKSYSKKQRITTLTIDVHPTIWGDQKLTKPKFVMPPNFATITGFRGMLRFLGSRIEEHTQGGINFSVLTRNNPTLRKNLMTLKSRIGTLFFWPVLLSNEMPGKSDAGYLGKPVLSHKMLPVAPCVTIPPIHKSYLKSELKKRTNQQLADKSQT